MGFGMKITFKFLCLAIVLNLIFVNIGFTQAPPAEEEEFNDLGFIAYANDYKVAPEF